MSKAPALQLDDDVTLRHVVACSRERPALSLSLKLSGLDCLDLRRRAVCVKCGGGILCEKLHHHHQQLPAITSKRDVAVQRSKKGEDGKKKDCIMMIRCPAEYV